MGQKGEYPTVARREGERGRDVYVRSDRAGTMFLHRFARNLLICPKSASLKSNGDPPALPGWQ